MNVLYILISIIILVIIIIACHYFLYYKQNNHIDNYIDDYIDLNEKIIIEKFDFNNYVLPKIIWLYWDDHSNIPLCVQQIVKNHKDTMKGWQINLLFDSTLPNYIPYIDLPIFTNLKAVHIADWIRLYLLEKYGGYWCDASLIINDKKACNQLRDESIKKKSLFTGFYNGDFCKKNKFCHVENSFMLAPKNSPVIKAWRKEFERAIDMGFENYKQLLKKNKKLKLYNIYCKNNDIYLTAFACFYNISEYFDQEIKDHFILYDTRNTIFKMQRECNWNTKCIHRKLNNKNAKKHPYIKLIAANRKGLDLSRYYMS